MGGCSWGLPPEILALQAPVRSVAEGVIELLATEDAWLIGPTLLADCISSDVGTRVGVALIELLACSTWFSGMSKKTALLCTKRDEKPWAH
jgi:hypothetical protein